MAERVQIPVYTDRWMMGDRYGEIVKISLRRGRKVVSGYRTIEMAHVKLDKSGKVMRFVLTDCTPV